MASLSSITRNYKVQQNAQLLETLRGNFPASAASVSATVGQIGAYDVINVKLEYPVSGYTIPMIENKSLRQTSDNKGVIMVGTQDGSNSPAATAWVLVDIIRVNV
jgi:hypothetical protein